MGSGSEYEVRRQLSQYVLSHGLAEGDVLPSIRSLAATFQVSTRTVQKAVGDLKREGLLQARPGAGIFVKRILAHAGDNRRIGFLHLDRAAYLQTRPYPGNVMDALQKQLASAGYELCPYSLKDLDPMSFVDVIRDANLGAVILFEIDNGFVIRELQELRLPMISMDYDQVRFGLSSVTFDNHMGGIEMTNHLLAHGHRQIAFIQSSYKHRYGSRYSLDSVTEERYEGYRIAMRLASLDPRKEHVDASKGKNKASALVARLLQDKNKPTAVICPSFGLGCDVAASVIDHGLSVPEDISVGAFGSSDREFAPGRALTTIRLDYEKMGKMSARYILSAMKEGMGQPERCALPARLAEGDSVSVLNTSKRRR